MVIITEFLCIRMKRANRFPFHFSGEPFFYHRKQTKIKFITDENAWIIMAFILAKKVNSIFTLFYRVFHRTLRFAFPGGLGYT